MMFLYFTQCGLYRKTDARDVPTNAKDRMAKNIEEGRSIKFGNLGKGKSGSFDFASSNEMWRATIEILDFVPLISADYGGGIVITDWYNDTDKKNESIKIMVQFLSNEIRADGIKVIVYNHGNEDFVVNNGDRIAQMILTPVIKMELQDTDELPESIRGEGGFGSTGK